MDKLHNTRIRVAHGDYVLVLAVTFGQIQNNEMVYITTLFPIPEANDQENHVYDLSVINK